MQNKFLFLVVSVFFVGWGGLIFSQKVSAQEKSPFSLSVKPAYQEVEITENDDTVDATLTYENKSDSIQEIELFAFDFKQTDHFGSLALIDNIHENYLHTLVSYLSFDKDSLILLPHTEETLTVKIKNRASLSPGGHYAAVVARAVDSEKENKEKVLPAISSLLLVRKIGGERVNLSLKEILWKPNILVTHIPSTIDLEFENNGNVHVIPRGTLKVTDFLGNVTHQGIINDSSLYLLPGTIRRIPISLQQSKPFFPIMLFFLDATGNADQGDVVFHSEQSFLYIDWRFLIFLGIFAVGALILFLKKRKKKHEKK